MRFDGSPSTSTGSAFFPTAIDPVKAAALTSRAGLIVAVYKASAGVRPAST